MSGMTVSAGGAVQLDRTLTEAGRTIADLEQVNRREGEATLAAAVIPRDTGHLESTATVLADDRGFTLTATAVYANRVHADNPFLIEALDRRETAITQGITAHVEGALATVQGA
jgi:hypothetical protein